MITIFFVKWSLMNCECVDLCFFEGKHLFFDASILGFLCQNIKMKNMRHLHFLLMLLFVVFSTFRNAQTIIQETFGSGIPTEWSVIDNNEDSQTWDGYASAGYTDTYSASIQAYAAHDDYLVMPQLTVEEGMTIEFVTKSHSTMYLEDMEVIASKDVDTADAFNIQLGDYQDIPGTW